MKKDKMLLLKVLFPHFMKKDGRLGVNEESIKKLRSFSNKDSRFLAES